ncbi:hypothetical protein BpHYR1_048289 [Brachionus plicatilis]|uniref:Uncharacterized protein n=1 Tax=Brachionus plicatilis TaxID=10195 RepID=A0A3M7Q185_BRAPC|nr:hypothetical protein BpHYR1_048289 [Brachionus plicatilis]
MLEKILISWKFILSLLEIIFMKISYCHCETTTLVEKSDSFCIIFLRQFQFLLKSKEIDLLYKKRSSKFNPDFDFTYDLLILNKFEILMLD